MTGLQPGLIRHPQMCPVLIRRWDASPACLDAQLSKGFLPFGHLDSSCFSQYRHVWWSSGGS